MHNKKRRKVKQELEQLLDRRAPDGIQKIKKALKLKLTGWAILQKSCSKGMAGRNRQLDRQANQTASMETTEETGKAVKSDGKMHQRLIKELIRQIGTGQSPKASSCTKCSGIKRCGWRDGSTYKLPYYVQRF